MNEAFDELAMRVTERLRGDPELRQEVAHELRAHLDDSTAEFRDAGMAEDEAAAAAVKALGEERDLAEQLWRANHRRIALRRTVRWTAGLAMAGGVAVACASLAWAVIAPVAMILAIFGQPPDPPAYERLARSIARKLMHDATAALPAESRLLVEPAPTPSDELTRARALAEAHPSDAVYWANYATHAMRTEPPTDALAILDHGKSIDPDNAFWPMMEASVLIAASSAEVANTPPRRFADTASDGKQRPWEADRYRITDPARFRRGLAELREAAGKRSYDNHLVAMYERRSGRLPPATHLGDQLHRLHLQGEVRLVDLGRVGELSRVVGAFAADLAERGGLDEALRPIMDVRAVAALMAPGARMLSQLSVASGLYHSTLLHEGIARAAAGAPRGEVDDVRRRLSDHEAARRSAWDDARPTGPDAMLRPGVIDAAMTGYRSLPDADLAPARRAEYAVVDRAAVTLSLAGLLATAAAIGVAAVAGRLGAGRWPAIVFIGWRRLAAVLLIAVALPVAAYAAYAYILPVGGRAYGLTASFERVVVEYAVVGCAIVVLLRASFDRALRRRAAEIGVPDLLPPERRRARAVVGVVVAAIAVAYLFLWHAILSDVPRGDLSLPTQGLGFLAAIVVIAYAPSWLRPPRAIAKRGVPAWATSAGVGMILLLAATLAIHGEPVLRRRSSTFSAALAISAAAALLTIGILRAVRTLRRAGDSISPGRPFGYGMSAAPVVLAAALTLALGAGLGLDLAERRAVAEMSAGTRSYSLFRDVDYGPWLKLKHRVAARVDG